LIYLAGRYNQQIKFYNVEKNFPAEVENFKNICSKNTLRIFSVTAAFRLIVGKILPKSITKAIYLDGDTICNLDIRELWQVELGDSPLAAVPEHDNPQSCWGLQICRDGFVKPENYFNSGVMIVNLEKFRAEENTIAAGIRLGAEKQYELFDQDILNYCFSEKALKLPRKYNVWVRTVKNFPDVAIEKKIYHYIGKGDSLGLDMSEKFNRLYWEYFAKTPFFNEEIFGNMFSGIRDFYAERQNLMIKISAAISGKSRVFVTISQNVDALKQIFYVKEGEEVIQINSVNDLSIIAEEMSKSAGKKIFFIFLGRIYSQLNVALTAAGFVEFENFINGEIFLSEVHGVPLDTYPIIKKM